MAAAASPPCQPPHPSSKMADLQRARQFTSTQDGGRRGARPLPVTGQPFPQQRSPLIYFFAFSRPLLGVTPVPRAVAARGLTGGAEPSGRWRRGGRRWPPGGGRAAATRFLSPWHGFPLDGGCRGRPQVTGRVPAPLPRRRHARPGPAARRAALR